MAHEVFQPTATHANGAWLNDVDAVVYGLMSPAQQAQSKLPTFATDANGKLQLFPYIAAQSAVPVILLPSSSIAANGVITVGTALPTTYANAWVYLPAGAAYTSSPAGVYFAQFTSTTSGTVYSNYAAPATTAFTPNMPTALGSPVVGTGAFTQTTATQLQMFNIPIAGGAMGLNGKTRISVLFSFNSSANIKIAQLAFGTSSGNIGQINTSTNTLFQGAVSIKNRGVLNSQISGSGGASGSAYAEMGGYLTAVTPYYTTLDTSVNQPLFCNLQLSTTATDYAVLEAFTIEILPA